MKGLTKNQGRVYDFVVAFKKANGMPPTRGEICEHFGWVSLNAADQHLKLIAKKGFIRILSGKRARGIEICNRPAGLGRNQLPIKEPVPTHQFE